MMDTSQEYILMCDKATEIQRVWKPKDGDCFFVKYGTFSNGHEPCNGEEIFGIGDVVWAGASVAPRGADTNDGQYVWLPRQDQLNCMFSKWGVFATLDQFNSWWRREAINKTKSLTTIDQLWLAFVMHVKFSKAWNGKDWA